ncbi:ABC transporter B family member 6-like [Beta vulgaris subsp. vulgaris]|uniref:ABC transporter B family member 6-like n=1 Tax=Beta vulgaris subsp. vulgaris TaxID=3555 RepID=UPI002037417B|nr:ABC transporter B family member 6-like [Beta vulgaris subsp. vulgaris]XP_048504320.1 ABC transporter B family member 6-like [Beta vulgaris subsp. vulgaris]
MSFFDTYGNNGDIVSQVLSDVLLIQSALSKKVGNYIHNMATFFRGLVVGFINCWQIALITLATGPFIVAAAGISNIFLHRLAENIQDAYAEAASIAEQVGTAVVTRSDGRMALGRLGALCEQLKELNLDGYEVILVPSGAGRQRLSFADMQKPQAELDGKACAAVGQNNLMALYDTLFS